MQSTAVAHPPMRRRLRGKQAGLQGPASANGKAFTRLLSFEDLSCLVTSWLDQRSLLRLTTVAADCREVSASPEAWREREVALRSRRVKNSQHLLKLLRDFAGRWSQVREAILPQLQPSAAAAKALCGALPSLRSLDLQLCPRAGGHRVLAELAAHPNLEQVILPGYLPSAPLPQLKVLKLTGSTCELHLEGLAEWERLPELVPHLEVLHAPWLDDEADEELSEDLWEKLHQPPLGCRTTDECLRHLLRLPELRELDLSGIYTITDPGLRTLGGLPKLERLVLRNLGSGVSSEGLRWLIDGGAPLRFLDLSLCKDTGRRPNSGRTALRQAEVESLCRRLPSAEVRFS